MVVKNPILILAFVYFVNFLLSLLYLQVVIIVQVFIQMVLARFRWFQLVLDGFSLFQIVLGCFSSFLTLVTPFRSYYSYKLRLLHELRDSNLSYLSKDKKRYKNIFITVYIKVFNKHILFGRRSEGVCILLYRKLS